MAKTEESDHIYCFHLGVKKAYSIAYQGNLVTEKDCLVSITLQGIIERLLSVPLKQGTEQKIKSDCDWLDFWEISSNTPMLKELLYRVAIMDWHSRKVLSWRLSNTIES